jgi:hypothetical protein
MNINREEYVIKMRKLFSYSSSITPTGELNHKYFHSKKGQYWSEEDNQNLIKGIEEFGVGAWAEIRAKYTQNWSEMDLKLRTGYLFKSFNVDKYNYITYTKEDIEKIANANEKEGREKNKFKFDIYLN